ncbi:MAG: hypothetical protein IPK16_00410 [Anaerolineales bacterium]|nr:hypothetical protein [Anaerolineales bacterium]
MRWIVAVPIYVLLRMVAVLLGAASNFVDNADWPASTQSGTDYRIDNSSLYLALGKCDEI